MAGKKGKKKPYIYKGDLAEPIAWPDMWDSNLTELLQKNLTSYILSEQIRKFKLLLEHYGIEQGPDATFTLAWKLAEEHVKGFKVTPKKSKSGQKERWKSFDGIELYARVQFYLNNGSSSVISACERIQEEGHFIDVCLETLQNAYYQFLKSPWYKHLIKNKEIPSNPRTLKEFATHAWLSVFEEKLPK